MSFIDFSMKMHVVCASLKGFCLYCTEHNKKQFELVVASEKKVVSRVVPLAGQAYRLEDHIAPNPHITQSFTNVSANFWIVGSVVVCR